MGYHIADKLSREHKDVVLIDRDAERLKYVAESLDIQTLHGSGASPALLRAAGLESADMMVAVTDSDESNLVACLVSRIVSPATTRIARIRNPEFLEIQDFRNQDMLGLSLIINPENEVIRTILRLLEVPGAVDVIDFAGGLVRLIGLKINPHSTLAGKTMIELKKVDPESHVLIVAIHRDNEVIIPHGQTRLEANDLVYVVARPPEVESILSFFDIKFHPARYVFIVGGGQVGTGLAQALEQKGIKVKLIDRNGVRCEELGQILNKTIVLKGDGTDQKLLEQENISDADFFISVSNDEEENVLSCLLARRLGARHSITRINKFGYIPLVAAIGLETLVSSRLSAVSAILQNIRKGKVVSVAALKGEDAEIIEFEVHEMSEISGKSLEQLKFPKQALIAAIVRREEVLIPRGQTVIQPQDRIIVISHRDVISKIEKYLSVRLEHF